MTTDVDQVLAEAAQAAQAAGKKTRMPKGDATATPKEPKAPKEPKVKLYVQWNEDGSPMLDESGGRVKGPVKMERPKVAKTPKLDADGNPIPRSPATRLQEAAVLTFTEKGKATTFKSGTKRGDNYNAITEGMTVGDYFAANGGRAVVATFLLWYIKEGLVEATVGEVSTQ